MAWTVGSAHRRRSRTGTALVAAALAGGLLASPAAPALASDEIPTESSVLDYTVLQPSDLDTFYAGLLDGLTVCGTQGGWYAAALDALDAQHGDPEGLSNGDYTFEGNYPNTQAWTFTPNDDVLAGDDVIVSFPAPPQPYSPSGASFPPARLPIAATGLATTTTVAAPQSAASGEAVTVTVTVRDDAGAPVAGQHVELEPRDPASPRWRTADWVASSTSSGAGGAVESTGADGTAVFEVSGVFDARRSFLATVGLDVRVVDTATTTFGTVDELATSGPCDGDEEYEGTSSEAPPWFVVYATEHGAVAEAASFVEVSRASGEVTAEVSTPAALPSGQTVYLVAVGAVSPPGGTEYPREAFPLSTVRDPVPAAPGVAPSYWSELQVSLDTTTVVPSGQTCAADTWCAAVSDTATTSVTVTARDPYHNPKPDHGVVLRDSTPEPENYRSHARVVPDDPEPDGSPTTGDDGTVTYQVGNSCAEDVRLQAGIESVDGYSGTVADDAVLRFLPAAPLPPSAPTAHSDCGVAPTSSRITVGTTVQGGSAPVVRWPGDGVTPLPVDVRLGDVYGNAVPGQSVLLADAAAGAGADPAPGGPACRSGSACTGADGTARFVVRGNAEDGPSRSAFTVTAVESGVVFPTDPSTHPQDVAQVEFLPVDGAASDITASSTTAAADGQPNTLVTVTLLTEDGQPMRGRPVTLSSGSTTFTATCEDTSQVACATDGVGEARFLVANTTPEQVVVTATSEVEGVSLAPLTIDYKPGGASLVLTPTSAVADGHATSEVRYALTGLDGAPVEGAEVTITPSTGAPVRAITDDDGRAVQIDASGTSVTPLVTSTTAGLLSYDVVATYTPSTSGSCPGRTEGSTCTVTTSPATVTWTAAPAQFLYDVTPAEVPADGRSTATVTVTALDAAGAPVPRLSLQLVPVGESSTPAPVPSPAQVTTDGDGRAAFTLTSTEHGIFEYHAQYPSADWTGVGTAVASVEFLQTQLSSSLVEELGDSSPAPADGTTPVRVRVTMRTDCGSNGCRPLPGTPVVLETGSSTTRVSSSSPDGTTDADGRIDFAVTDTEPEQLQVYARDVSRNVRIGPLAVEFLPTEADVSTVTASPEEVEAGGAGSTITVTLLDHLRRPLTGRQVALTTSSSAARVVPVDGGTTDAEGAARFTVTSSRLESVVVRATDTTNGVRLTDTATVHFVGSEANQSTVRAALSEVPAGGPGTTLTVTLRDGDGTPLAGRGVDVLGASSSTTVRPLISGGVTDAYGVAEFEVASTAVETVTFSARDRSNGVVVQQTATVVFAAHEANQSSVVGPGAVAAVGPPGVVAVTLRDRAGAPLVGHTVSLLSDSPTAVSSPASVATDGAGRALFEVSDDVVEQVVFTALDRSTGVTVQQTATVDFYPDEANQSTATASPPDQKVRKNVVITVTLRDAAGQPLAGHGVRLDTGSDTAKVTALDRRTVTDEHGVLQFEVTDRNPGRLDIAVTDTTTGVRLYRPVVVHFYK